MDEPGLSLILWQCLGLVALLFARDLAYYWVARRLGRSMDRLSDLFERFLQRPRVSGPH